MGPETLLPIGGIILAYFMTRKPKKKKSTKKPVAQACPPFAPIDELAVRDVAEEALDKGITGVGAVASYVGQVLYPKDVNNKVIPWPKVAPWEMPLDASEPVVCLYGEIKSIVSSMDIPAEKPDGGGTKKPGEVLTELLSDTPTLGKYYLIKNGDVALGANGVLAKALDGAAVGADTGGNRLALLKLMTLSPWNRTLYARTNTTANWPAYTNADGQNLGAAWLPRHQSAISKIASGEMPKRNISSTGVKQGTGSSYALLWFPPLDLDAFQSLGVVTDGGATWDDGTSVLNPPPDLLELLKK
jgi:hypothetical protein